uniref:Uncharacterized protein n=1 Tax=Trichuris muris TaxID=70415 RepID=A0A5S6QVD8_TRIMR
MGPLGAASMPSGLAVETPGGPASAEQHLQTNGRTLLACRLFPLPDAVAASYHSNRHEGTARKQGIAMHNHRIMKKHTVSRSTVVKLLIVRCVRIDCAQNRRRWAGARRDVLGPETPTRLKWGKCGQFSPWRTTLSGLCRLPVCANEGEGRRIKVYRRGSVQK